MEWIGLIIALLVVVIAFSIVVILMEEDMPLRFFKAGLLLAMLFMMGVFYSKGYTDGKRNIMSKIAEKYGASTKAKQWYVVWKCNDFMLYFPDVKSLNSFIKAIEMKGGEKCKK